ncbi:serine protease inhibitor Kazal-type 2 isoform X1 [Leptonychotes weddellii]|uniref:Serine protease inhibitor Kazal-type 1 n=1 Tax=Leptonychotes weddellii TaxID=9713 RepID=A0A7F8QJ41_LEPWE|nr:serine protease inhibitor Kazal-type 2 isoform X1 [Leptonychotes weddellii]
MELKRSEVLSQASLLGWSVTEPGPSVTSVCLPGEVPENNTLLWGRGAGQWGLMKEVSLDSLSSEFDQHSEYRTPNCNQYKLPGCPRDFSPVCGSDMSTYPNECTLCLKIREDGHDIKIIRSGPC